MNTKCIFDSVEQQPTYQGMITITLKVMREFLSNVKKRANSAKSHEEVKSMATKLDKFEYDIEHGLNPVAASSRVMELSKQLIQLEEDVNKKRLSGILAKHGMKRG